MIRIEFPADRPDIARAIGTALVNIGADHLKGVVLKESAKPVEVQGTLEETASDFPAPAEMTATVAGETIEPQPDPGLVEDDEVAPASDSPEFGPLRDTKGVAFNRDLCAISKDPYYSSGPRAGQWKKRKGVGEDRYDNWYRESLANAGAPATTTAASVFGAPAAAQTPAQTTPAEPAAPSPTAGPGHLFKWLTGLQTTGQITREGVDAAWKAAGLTMVDLLPPNPAATIEQNLVTLYRAIQAEIENEQ